ncbi:high mobility group nucleosome-binding domain-containing protein 5-like [Nerophis ophidion]|uniref:high mobility group nucleosome-binding domain-containing protein 5-like n=1 Tax=Nerophis ophidion TaxID=159077 RepID=UPI002ADFC9F9|nr:high mobility group nucleosome-binding domain-containing protein 5-like [Nerophis ophidion]
MHHDGSLVVTKLSSLHEGLYYCLLRHDGGSTLFPYQLYKRPEDVGQEYFRFRRELGPVAEEQENVSDRLLAGAVAASVLLTFVFGFSAGALSRRNVLRCWTGLTKILPASSPRQQHDLSDADITMATLSSMYNKREQVTDDETTSSLGSNPPAKPQRSFRERQEAQAYWEACDRVEGRSIEEARGRLEECDGKVREVKPSGQDKDEEGMSRKEEEDGEAGGFDGRIAEDDTGEENDDGKNSRKEDDEKEDEEDEKENEVNEKKKNEKVKTENEVDEQENEEDEKEKNEIDEKEKIEVNEKKKIEVDVKKNKEDEKGEESNDEDEGADVSSESLSSQTDGGEDNKEELCSSQVSPSRSSRVIRLYQYDEDGRRYGHLPDPGPEEPGPAPKLKQRSASLTRLNAIMAAASAGPLDTPPRGQGGSARTETTHFGMDI